MNKNPPPPKLLLHFFRWYCHPDYQEDIEGDLRERFERRVVEKGIRAAQWGFFKDVLLLFRPEIIRPIKGNYQLNHSVMFKHNLLITYRSFLRNKSSFLINLIGLSTGLACVLLVYLWVSDELSVDKFHKKDTQLYQVMYNHEASQGIQTWDHTPVPLAAALSEEMPEVEYAVAVNDFFSWRSREGILSVGDTHLPVEGWHASKDFFHVFSYELIQGDKNQVLADKNNIVISEELAKKLFTTTDNVIGKTLEWKHPFFEGMLPGFRNF